MNNCETKQHFTGCLFPTLEVSCDHVVGRLIYTDLVSVVQKIESCYPKSNSVANAISLINN